MFQDFRPAFEMSLHAERRIADDEIEGVVKRLQRVESVAGDEPAVRQKFPQRCMEAFVEFAAKYFAAGGRGADEGTVATARVHDALAGARLGEPIHEAGDRLRGEELADHGAGK